MLPLISYNSCSRPIDTALINIRIGSARTHHRKVPHLIGQHSQISHHRFCGGAGRCWSHYRRAESEAYRRRSHRIPHPSGLHSRCLHHTPSSCWCTSLGTQHSVRSWNKSSCQTKFAVCRYGIKWKVLEHQAEKTFRFSVFQNYPSIRFSILSALQWSSSSTLLFLGQFWHQRLKNCWALLWFGYYCVFFKAIIYN